MGDLVGAPGDVIRAQLLSAGALSLSIAGAALGVGCGDDPRGPCHDAYLHLLEVGRRNPDPELERRFIDACVDAWDAAQVRCLLRADTADEAVACRPTKSRPG
ncbi:MAG: hypothetical protein CSA66_01375 [Proteobacteria bacterium]|nr:MAG: hypothetical protein CSA66_01375 [Pseudomonadota bacterium]